MDTIKIKLLNGDAKVPVRKHAGDAGLDICSTIDCVIDPGERAIIPTGIAVAIPENTVLYLCPRSGLAAKHGITIVNSPATIDVGFRGELKVILLNTGHEAFSISKGDRIAQMELLPCLFYEPVVVDELSEAVDDRGVSDFGSTGVK